MFLTGAETTLTAAGLAFTGAMLALRQKALTDRRAAWWTRAQWAIDKSLEPDPYARRIGTEAMQVLALDPKATRADLDVLDAALVRALAR